MVEEGEEQLWVPAHATDALAALRGGVSELVAAKVGQFLAFEVFPERFDRIELGA